MKKLLPLIFISFFLVALSVYASTGVDPLSVGIDSSAQTDTYNNTAMTAANANRRSTMQNQVGATISDHEQTLDETERNINQALNNINQAVTSYRSVNSRFLQ